MEARIEVSYQFAVLERKFKAKISVTLPAGEDRRLSPSLCSIRDSICGQSLSENWGEFYDGARHRSIIVDDEDINNLVLKVGEIVKKIEFTIQKVVSEYREMRGTPIPPGFQKSIDL